ncbi:MAG: hypothetical protein AB7P52_11700 [Alphaproteobacteria bacterium]
MKGSLKVKRGRGARAMPHSPEQAARLAEALRENLRKRRAQKEARAAAPSAPPSADDEDARKP